MRMWISAVARAATRACLARRSLGPQHRAGSGGHGLAGRPATGIGTARADAAAAGGATGVAIS
jgi:hypothetical protein